MPKGPAKRRGDTPARESRKPTDPNRVTKSGRLKLPAIAKKTPKPPEGATEDDIGDRIGPGAGYDDEPEQVKDKGGVS